MKNLKTYLFNATQCRQEWYEFEALLKSKSKLEEQKDVLPFFKKRHDLSTLIGNYFPKLVEPNTLAHEYEIYGDFVADLVVGDSSRHRYLLVEFENGDRNSVFKQVGQKAIPEWAPRFEKAYSQLVDWFWKREDMRNTSDFLNTFGSHQATFKSLIVIGKDMELSPQEQDRLKW